MTLPLGTITLCPTWAVRHECVFVEFLRLRANDIEPGELTAIACTVACFERIRGTFPKPDSDLLVPAPENTKMCDRKMSLGELDDSLASCDIIIDHLPPDFFQHVRDVTGLQDQLRKQWQELDAENKIKGLRNWKGDDSENEKVAIHTTIADLINMRNNFILLIKNKGKQFLSFEAMLCICRSFKAIEDLENSVEGFPSSQRQNVPFDRVKLNDIDLPKPYLSKVRDMKVPKKLLTTLKDTTQMCAGNSEVLKDYGCFKNFLALPGDPATKNTVYVGVANPGMEVEAFSQTLAKVE